MNPKTRKMSFDEVITAIFVFLGRINCFSPERMLRKYHKISEIMREILNFMYMSEKEIRHLQWDYM
jgi:hypothetical protein